jgi:tetratricopeptide (TPR) repeat protein
LGFAWALLQDTDIRLRGNPAGLIEFLARTDATVVSFLTEPERVPKAMLWRLPRAGYFDDEPHEWYRGLPEPPVVFHGLTVLEVQRTPEEWTERGRQIALKLEPRVAADPNDWRKTWYLAEAYRDSGQVDKACNAYKVCFRLLGSVGDWAAQCLWRVACARLDSDPRKALDFAVQGQLIAPDFPEFWWLAGVAADRLGQPELAARYASEAARLGPDQRKRGRKSWSYRQSWYHSPYDVLDWAYQAMGMPDLAAQHRWQHDRLLERFQKS